MLPNVYPRGERGTAAPRASLERRIARIESDLAFLAQVIETGARGVITHAEYQRLYALRGARPHRG